MKVALILLDDYQTETGSDFADLGELLLERVLIDKECEFKKFDYFNKNELPDINEFDVIYLTGSRNDSWVSTKFNDLLIEHVCKIIENGKSKLIGVCFGHQIIGRALGLRVIRNPLGWEIGSVIVNTIDDGKYIINEMHQDIVADPTDEEIKKLDSNGVKIIGSNELCKVQGFSSEKLLTFQGHPEFSTELTISMVKKKVDNGIWDSDKLTKVIEQSKSNTVDDGVLNIISKFIK